MSPPSGGSPPGRGGNGNNGSENGCFGPNPVWINGPRQPLGPPSGPPSDPDNGPANGGPRRYDDDDRPRVARVKEADKIELLKFPQGTAWRTWRAHTIHAIVSAAGRQGYLAQEWILIVESQDLTALQER